VSPRRPPLSKSPLMSKRWTGKLLGSGPAQLPVFISVTRPFVSATPWPNKDGGVLPRLIWVVHADNEPGAIAPLQEVAWHEHLVGEPEFPMAVGILNGEGAGQLTPSAPPGAMAQSRDTAEGRAVLVT